MHDRTLKLTLTAFGWTLGAVASILLSTSAAVAQKMPVPNADSARTRMTSDDEREAQMASLGTVPASKVDPKKLSAAQARVQEDFVQIITLHNLIADIATGKAMLDYHVVSDAAADVKKRANRLQQTLLLAKAPGTQQTHPKRVKYQDAQIRQALVALCQHIRAFVTNPVIEHPGTVDPMQLSKASDDLSGIIELSGSIKKSADRLGKN